jgi:HD superfamily phosphodiesterase
MDFQAAKNYIIKRLTNELSTKLYYHGLHHTLYVCDAAERIARQEAVTAEQLILLKTAALFHDAGFIEQYNHNEIVGAKIAQQALPQFGYNQNQIDIIASTIMATSRIQAPQTLLEKILCDADLDHLGTDSFKATSDSLKKELEVQGVSYNEQQWDELQIKFLESHQYYTASSIKNNNATKQKHLNEIKERVLKNS